MFQPFSPKVADMLLTSGWCGGGERFGEGGKTPGEVGEGERRENAHTCKSASPQNYKSQRNGSFIPILNY